MGSFVQVPFHGRATRGWVLGPTDDVPPGMLKVRKAVSAVRFFDERMLELLRWMSERYVAPVATAIVRSHPPRVASEETQPAATSPRADRAAPTVPAMLGRYREGNELLRAVTGGAGAFIVRAAPEEEQAVVVEAVGATLAGGRTAVVIVPEAKPLPASD